MCQRANFFNCEPATGTGYSPAAAPRLNGVVCGMRTLALACRRSATDLNDKVRDCTSTTKHEVVIEAGQYNRR